MRDISGGGLVSRNEGNEGRMSAMRRGGGSFGNVRGGEGLCACRVGKVICACRVVEVMCECRVGEVVCVCGAGEGWVELWCGTVWSGMVWSYLICGIWLRVYVGLGRDVVVLWWEMEGS